MIESLSGIESAKNLKELHIRKNNIFNLSPISGLAKLQSLDASQNNIKEITQELIKKLEGLSEVKLEKNPCLTKELSESLKHNLLSEKEENLAEPFEGTKPFSSPFKNLANALNYAKICEIKNTNPDHSIVADKSHNSTVRLAPDDNDIISRIREEWKLEEQKGNIQQKSVAKELSKLFYSTLEKEGVLHLYGVAALDALTKPEYEASITEIIFECMKFDHIVYQPVIQQLLKYKHLTTVTLSRNLLGSFVLLSKLETLGNIKKLNITDNSIMKLKTLDAFIAYRFQHLEEFNGKKIGDKERKIAKQQFEKFDRSLASATLANKKHLAYKRLGCSKSMIKAISKENDIAAAQLFSQVAREGEQLHAQLREAESKAEDYVVNSTYAFIGQLNDDIIEGST